MEFCRKKSSTGSLTRTKLHELFTPFMSLFIQRGSSCDAIPKQNRMPSGQSAKINKKGGGLIAKMLFTPSLF